jgi:glycosyltransferase involved in cell wall biosynthesis
VKVLHVSQLGLPHWRVEKSAITGINYGYKVFFAGLSSPESINNSKVFEKIYKLNWPVTNYPKVLLIPYILLGKPSIWLSVKKQIKIILEDLRPDIVHAHNLISAKLISEFDIPMIYNDHEYWSIYIKRKYESKLLNNNTNSDNNKVLRKVKSYLYNRIINIWSKWEADIVTRYPTFVVSKTIANEMKQKYSNKVFLLPNCPKETEIPVSYVPLIHDDLNSVYAGIEPLKEASALSAHRNITGLDLVFNENDVGKLVLIGRTNFQPSAKVICKGLLSRNEMYNEMAKCSIGLLPMKKIWSHKYINPNKTFEYAHAGLHVVCTSSFSDVVETLDNNCTTIEDYDDLVTQLLYLRDNKEELFKKRIKIHEFAKKNLTWERYEGHIIEAYKNV